MSLGSGISSNLNNRFEALCDECVLKGEGFGLKFEAGQWKIKRDGIDTEFQVFSIKVPRGADKVEYLHLLAEEFKDDDEFIEKLLHTAAKTVEAFAVAQQWLGSSVATGTIKFGFTGKVQSSDFEATSIASNIGGLQREAKAEDKGKIEERVRGCANDIFGRYIKEATAPPKEEDEDPSEVDSRSYPSVDSRVEQLESEDDDDAKEFAMDQSLYRLGSRVSGRRSSIDILLEDPLNPWISSQFSPPPPPPRAHNSEGEELREISKAVFEKVKTDLGNHIEEMSPRSFASARAEIYRFFNDTKNEIASLKSAIPLADSSGTKFDADSEAARFLTCLFNVKTQQEVIDTKTALDSEGMWYRLQLALIQTAYEVEQEKQASMADRSELLQKLLLRTKNREYPDVFYISESSHTLKSRSSFLSEIQKAASFMEDDPYVLDENFRQKLIGNIDRSPHEMTYNFYSK